MRNPNAVQIKSLDAYAPTLQAKQKGQEQAQEPDAKTIKDKSHYKYAIFGKNPYLQNEESRKIREQSKSLEEDAKEGERRSSLRKENDD